MSKRELSENGSSVVEVTLIVTMAALVAVGSISFMQSTSSEKLREVAGTLGGPNSARSIRPGGTTNLERGG